MGTIIDGFAQAFRDYVTDGVRASGARDIVKADARGLGPVIESALAAIGMGALVSVVHATRSDLDADLAHAAAAVALVYADATDANNDLYTKVGDSGAGSWTLTSALHDSVYALNLPYLKSFRVVSTYGDRSAIPAQERAAGMLVKVVEAIDQGDGTFRPLWFTLDATDLTNAGWKTAPEMAQNWVAFVSPPIFDGGTLYIPPFYVLTYEGNGYGTYYVPADGSYVASPGSTGNNIRRHVFDMAVYAAGGTVDDAIREVDDGAIPLRDTQTQVVLAVTRNGRLIDSRDYTLAGDIPGGSVPNLFNYGLAVDDAPWIYPGAVPADIPDADLIAAGFTRGVQGAPNTPVTIGDYLAPFEVGDWVVTRFRLYAEAAGVFGVPHLYIYTTEQAVNPPLAPTLFRQINDHVREYYYAGRLTVAGNGKWAVGSDNTANASPVWVTGVQFWRGSEAAFWIAGGDFPSAGDAAPLMADDIWMTSDRPLPLIAGNGMADRTLDVVAEVATSPEPALPLAAQPYFATARGDEAIWLSPAQLAGQSVSLTMRARVAMHSIINRVLPVHVRTVPLVAPVDIKVAYFGDSHSAGYFPRYLKTLLAAWNINVSFYGTLDNTFGDLPGETRQYGEGRGGWSLANIMGTYQLIGGTGSENVWDTVLGPGSIAGYTGADFSTRQRTNPFLNNGASASSAPVIAGVLPLLGGGTAGGFRFDLVNYRTRFALPTDIDFVLWDIGDNDVGQVGSAEAVARMNALYPIMLAEIRRAWADAQILCWAGGIGMTTQGEIRWKDTRPVLAAQLAAMRTAVTGGDGRLHYVSGWMHHTIRSGFSLNAGTVDAVTQATRTTIADDVHPGWPGRQQSLEPLCAAIANLVGV